MDDRSTLNGLVVKITPKAILFKYGERQAWLPRSQIHGRFKEEQLCSVKLPQWLLEKSQLTLKENKYER